MADPILGNSATETGQMESGADFQGINASGFAASGPVLEVKVRSDGNDIELRRDLAWEMPQRIEGQPHPDSLIGLPPEQRASCFTRRLELTHSDTDILAAQLLEDPDLTTFSIPNVGAVQASPSRLASAVSRNQNRERLIWFGIDASNLSAALGDRIIVRRDTLESEYVCRSCAGKGHTDETCKLCDGEQQKEGVACKSCMVLGFEAEKPHPSGFTRCPSCSGVGWRNGIVIPEVAQGKPVTGVVVSLGPATTLLKLGDRVLHSKYAGHTLEMKAETYTFMREAEVISLLRDLT